MTKEEIYKYIKKNKYAVLSTVSKDQSPESAIVGIAVTPDIEILFDTLSTSRKYKI